MRIVATLASDERSRRLFAPGLIPGTLGESKKEIVVIVFVIELLSLVVARDFLLRVGGILFSEAKVFRDTNYPEF